MRRFNCGTRSFATGLAPLFATLSMVSASNAEGWASKPPEPFSSSKFIGNWQLLGKACENSDGVLVGPVEITVGQVLFASSSCEITSYRGVASNEAWELKLDCEKRDSDDGESFQTKIALFPAEEDGIFLIRVTPPPIVGDRYLPCTEN